MRTRITDLFGIEHPIIQGGMHYVGFAEMAAAVSNAGGLGSLPCAMLSPDAMRQELAAIRAQTSRPYNVNFFCHTPPEPDRGAGLGGGGGKNAEQAHQKDESEPGQRAFQARDPGGVEGSGNGQKYAAADQDHVGRKL